jgi:hypothetical protein
MGPADVTIMSSITKNSDTGPAAADVLRELRDLLQSLTRERREIVRRMCAIKQTIVGLASLYGDEVLDDELLELIDRKRPRRRVGLTKACRMVLIQAGKPLTTREVCDRICLESPSMLVSHKDAKASIHTLLSRLAEYGEARPVTDERGRRLWEWATQSESQLPEVRTGSKGKVQGN